jgi:hypothetical protein
MTSTGSSDARFLARRDAQLRVLLDTLAGVALTEQDRRLASWLAGWQPAAVEGLAGLIRRARGSAPESGPGSLGGLDVPGASQTPTCGARHGPFIVTIPVDKHRRPVGGHLLQPHPPARAVTSGDGFV